MAKIITITNGVGTSDVINGNYDVTSEVTGYENTSINPSNVQIVEGTNTYAFTIAATGTLTLHVSEDGTSEGVPVVGATFIRTDSDGNEYCLQKRSINQSGHQRLDHLCSVSSVYDNRRSRSCIFCRQKIG